MSSIFSGVENLVGIPTSASNAAKNANNAATNYYGQLGTNAATDASAFNANVNPLLAAFSTAAGLPSLSVPGAATAGGGGTANGQPATASNTLNGANGTNGTAAAPNPNGTGPVASNPYQLTQAQSQELLQQQTSYMKAVNNAASQYEATARAGGANSQEIAETKALMQQQAQDQTAAMAATFTQQAQTNAQNAALQGLQFFANLQNAGQQGLGQAAQGSMALAENAQQQVNQSENAAAGVLGMFDWGQVFSTPSTSTSTSGGGGSASPFTGAGPVDSANAAASLFSGWAV